DASPAPADQSDRPPGRPSAASAISMPEHSGSAPSPSRPEPTHPLLGPPRPTAPGGFEFEMCWGRAELLYLVDHRVHGAMVLPLPVALEAALGAGRAWLGEGPLGVEHVLYHEPLSFESERSRSVRIALSPHSGDRAAFSLTSATDDGDGARRTHVT